MHGLRIKDGAPEQGGLNFDLEEVLEALGSHVDALRWTCRDAGYLARDGAGVPG